MMTDNDIQNWHNATWEGSRRAQLRASLKLTPKQRFEALEELADTGRWLAGGMDSPTETRSSIRETKPGYSKKHLDHSSKAHEE